MTDAMSRAFDLVIFDWAGTMVDFGCCAPMSTMVEAFSRRGVELDETAARAEMEKTKDVHFRALLAQPETNARWKAATGAPPGERDFASLMQDLGPLMRDAAADAAELIPAPRKRRPRSEQAA